jgi:protein subunit release factor A
MWNPEEIKYSVPPSKGGQHVGVDPTVIGEYRDIKIECGAHRSQHKNKQAIYEMFLAAYTGGFT